MLDILEPLSSLAKIIVPLGMVIFAVSFFVDRKIKSNERKNIERINKINGIFSEKGFKLPKNIHFNTLAVAKESREIFYLSGSSFESFKIEDIEKVTIKAHYAIMGTWIKMKFKLKGSSVSKTFKTKSYSTEFPEMNLFSEMGMTPPIPDGGEITIGKNLPGTQFFNNLVLDSSNEMIFWKKGKAVKTNEFNEIFSIRIKGIFYPEKPNDVHGLVMFGNADIVKFKTSKKYQSYEDNFISNMPYLVREAA